MTRCCCNPQVTSARGGHVSVAVVVAAVALTASSAVATSRSDAAAAAPCRPAATRAALASFVAAFNSGKYSLLDALFAQRPLFRWYSSNVPGVRRTLAARNRKTLISYFRSRHLKRDRLLLVAFAFTGTKNGLSNFTFKLRRSASDYKRGAWFGLVGKGAAVCSPPSPYIEGPEQFVVMSIGGPGSDKR
jgi:hypothetical protein